VRILFDQGTPNPLRQSLDRFILPLQRENSLLQMYGPPITEVSQRPIGTKKLSMYNNFHIDNRSYHERNRFQ
jgi:hypothetical protein